MKEYLIAYIASGYSVLARASVWHTYFSILHENTERLFFQNDNCTCKTFWRQMECSKKWEYLLNLLAAQYVIGIACLWEVTKVCWNHMSNQIEYSNFGYTVRFSSYRDDMTQRLKLHWQPLNWLWLLFIRKFGNYVWWTIWKWRIFLLQKCHEFWYKKLSMICKRFSHGYCHKSCHIMLLKPNC